MPLPPPPNRGNNNQQQYYPPNNGQYYPPQQPYNQPYYPPQQGYPGYQQPYPNQQYQQPYLQQPYQQQPYQQNIIIQQPKKKNIFLRILTGIGTVFGIIIVLGVIGALVSGGSSDMATIVSQGTTTEEKIPVQAVIGDVVEYKNVSYELNDVEVESDSYFNSNGKETLNLYITQTNNSNEAVSYNALNFEVTSPTGETFTAFGINETNTASFSSGDLQPGKSHYGVVSYSGVVTPGIWELTISTNALAGKDIAIIEFEVE